MSFGRDFRPSLVTPSAIAPLETTTTLRLAARAAATSAARRSQASPESDFDPILITTRRDLVIALRTRLSSLARATAAISISIAIFVTMVPGIQSLFGTASIPLEFWFLPLPLALGILCMDEIRKVLVRSFPRSIFARIAW